MRRAGAVAGIAFALVLVAGGEGGGSVGPAGLTPRQVQQVLQHSPLPPVPEAANAFADDDDAARLGQFLFFDTRMSRNGEVACATCHDPARGFTDGRPVSEGIATGRRNTPALWNTAYSRWYFWDGRADSLWSQALVPIEAAAEMGSSRLEVLHLVHRDTALRAAYERVFGALPDLDDLERFPAAGRPVPGSPDHPHEVAWRSMSPADREAVTRAYVNLGKAIAAYQRRLVSGRSPFDRFVEGVRTGDAGLQAALSPAARRGLEVFLGPGQCRLCHHGPLFTDGEFHNIRVPPRGGGAPRDPGRFEGLRVLRASPFNAAGEYSDAPQGAAAQRLAYLADSPQTWGAFKTPSLRNVALTAPYMHQGQFETLDDVLEYYSTLEGAIILDHHDEMILAPRNFTAQQKADLIAFLESLTDTGVDPALLKPPESP